MALQSLGGALHSTAERANPIEATRKGAAAVRRRVPVLFLLWQARRWWRAHSPDAALYLVGAFLALMVGWLLAGLSAARL
jgi:hypothetical protein